MRERYDFNPRPPRGGRQSRFTGMGFPAYFNPRPPRGGRPNCTCYAWGRFWISIHAPREGGDGTPQKGVDKYRHFNPRPPRGGRQYCWVCYYIFDKISIHAPREGGDSKDAQFYLRIFDKQVELLRFLGKIRGGCLRNPEKDRRFLGKSLANLPEISGHLDFAGGGKARPGYPCAVPLPRRAACVRGSGDPPADRCSSYRNAPLFSHIASLDSKSADCLSQNP